MDMSIQTPYTQAEITRFDIYVVGCGGIGNWLLQKLPFTLVDIALECMNPDDQEAFLKDSGKRLFPAVAGSLTLIDGDSFDPHNAARQAAGVGDKLAVHLKMLRESLLFNVQLAFTEVRGVGEFITPANIAEIIPATPLTNTNARFLAQSQNIQGLVSARLHRNMQQDVLNSTRDYRLSFGYTAARHVDDRSKSCTTPVVFLCVDNHRTRYEVSRYMETFESAIVINGGNDKLVGNANLWQKYRGHELDPRIYHLYPEIADPSSKRPDQVGCGEIQLGHDQIAITNSQIADYMCLLFRSVALGQVARHTNGTYKRLNEVVVDLSTCRNMPLFHKIDPEQLSAQAQ